MRRQDLDAFDEPSRHGDGHNDADADADSELEAILNAQIAKALGIDTESLSQYEPTINTNDKGQSQDINAEKDISDDGYEFNLFSTAASAPKIFLVDEDAGTGSFVKNRPRSHFQVTQFSAKAKKQFAFAAVSSDEVLRRSKQRSWGLELPWKVTKTSIIIKSISQDDKQPNLEDLAKHTEKQQRPGKKSRILNRKRAKSQLQQAEESAKKMEEKEEQIKDKKKRLNRIKKLRKRAKEKEKKQQGEAQGATNSDDDDEHDSEG